MQAVNIRNTHYQFINESSSVDGASPARLVLVLFETLIRKLKQAEYHLKEEKFAKKTENVLHALRIVDALEDSLDFEKGGDIAHNLAILYKHCRGLIVKGHIENDAAEIVSAIEILDLLEDAWSQIC